MGHTINSKIRIITVAIVTILVLIAIWNPIRTMASANNKEKKALQAYGKHLILWNSDEDGDVARFTLKDFDGDGVSELVVRLNDGGMEVYCYDTDGMELTEGLMLITSCEKDGKIYYNKTKKCYISVESWKKKTISINKKKYKKTNGIEHVITTDKKVSTYYPNQFKQIFLYKYSGGYEGYTKGDGQTGYLMGKEISIKKKKYASLVDSYMKEAKIVKSNMLMMQNRESSRNSQIWSVLGTTDDEMRNDEE